MRDAPSVSGAVHVHTDNPLACDVVAELVDCIFWTSGRVGGGAWRSSTEEFFDVAILIGGESCELGIVGGELGKDFFFHWWPPSQCCRGGCPAGQTCGLYWS